MRVYKLLVTGSLAGMILSLPAMAQSKRKTCPRPTVYQTALTDSEFSQKMEGHPELVEKTQGMRRSHLEQFLFEYDKFPADLKAEMVSVGASINLVSGEGVTADDSWNFNIVKTKDNRDWSKVPGSGGYAYRLPQNPTRIAVNHLYDRHGSINLILHEHAHTLDHLYSIKDVSNSTTWKDLIKQPDNINGIEILCGDYCLTSADESFAELFAYYHACPATQEHIEQIMPTVANFLSNLTSIKVYKENEARLSDGEGADVRIRTTNEPTQTTPRKRRTLGSFFKKLANNIGELVDPDQN